MPQPTLCVIYEDVGDYNAISKIAATAVQQALKAQWRVTVVAQRLSPALQKDVEWLRLFKPRRLFLVQWLVARTAIRAALKGRTFDVLHVYQPQVADLADLMHCQFLTRVAYERDCLESRPGFGPAIVRAQQQGVLYAEDYYLRHWNPKTRLLFCSPLVREEFHRLYGRPPLEGILSNACPPVHFTQAEERTRARKALLGHDYDGPVIGYLGGVNERKGYRPLIHAVEEESKTFLLMGGSYTAGFKVSALKGRFQSVGLVSDLRTFYAACDIMAVPSYFDPCPLVVFEAAARGLPVIATDGVGNLPTLIEYGAGLRWGFDEPLGPLVQEMMARREQFQAGARRMAADLSEERQGERLLQVYEEVLQEKKRRMSVNV